MSEKECEDHRVHRGDKSKKCTRCWETKPYGEFNLASNTADGHQYWCKGCQRANHEGEPKPPAPKGAKRGKIIRVDVAQRVKQAKPPKAEPSKVHWGHEHAIRCGRDPSLPHSEDAKEVTCKRCLSMLDHGADERKCLDCGLTRDIEYYPPTRSGSRDIDPVSGKKARYARCEDCIRVYSHNQKRRERGLMNPLPGSEYIDIDDRFDPELFDTETASRADWLDMTRECPPDWWWQNFLNGIEAGVLS